MTKLLLALSLALAISAHAATQPSSNIPIGKMPIATNLKTSAFVPIIQPYDGRTTNDNFRISPTNWLGFSTNAPAQYFFSTNISVTNLTVQNITVISNTTGIEQFWRTNASGLYFPSITNTPTIVVGQSAEAWWVPSTGDGFVSVHDSSVGDSDFNSIAIAAIDNVIQENYSAFSVGLHSGVAPSANMNLDSNTNYQDPAAPISKFSVQLQPTYGEVLLQLINNGVTELEVSNQVTSVQGLQLSPLTNAVIGIGNNNINVASNSYVRIQASFADPTITAIELSAGVRDGMLLLLQNIGTLSGFTLFNGSLLYDDPSHFVTLNNGNWVTTNSGDGLLLIGGASGWFEIGRFISNTNTITGDALWELSSNHMRTVPDFVEDWQFRYGGTPQLTISTNGELTASFFSLTDDAYLHLHGPTFSEVQLDGASAGSQLDLYNDDTQSYIHFQSSIDGGIRTTILEPTQTEGAPGTDAPFWFGSVPLYTTQPIFSIYNGTSAITNRVPILSFGPDSRMTLGTNIAHVGLNSTLAEVVATDGVDLKWTNSTAKIVRFWNNRVHPLQSGIVLGGDLTTSPKQPFSDLNLDGSYYHYGYIGSDVTNYSRMKLTHGGTNSVILLSSESSGDAGVARPFKIDRNLGATLAVGDVAVVDMFTPSATNAIAGTMTFTHATNGLDLVEFTHVRTFFNGSGSDRTVNLPSGWHKGAGAGSSFVVTNATMAKLYVTCMGPTGSAALQTNVTATVSFFP